MGGRSTVRLTLTSVFDDKGMKKAENALRDFDKKMEEMGGASSLAHKIAEVSTKAERMGARIQRAGRAIADVGDSMTAGITAPLVAVGGYAANAAMQFESSMSRVAGALNDPTANMGRLRQLALDMGESTVFSASEAAAAMEELAKGGLTAAQIEAGALQTAMDLAAAGGMSLADAANAVVQSMGAFGLGAEQSGQAANALAGAASASSADVSDLTQGLSQASAQANSAGWSIQDTTAVLGAFADAGIMGSDAGTSLKTMLQRLSAPTDTAAAMMEELGIQTRDGSGQLLGASEMAAELSAKLGTLSSAEKDAAMQTIFSSDASRAALVMTNLGAEGLEKYVAATNDQEAAQRMANAQMGETERAMEEMKGAVETAAIQLGTALAPAVTEAAEAVGKAAEAFSEMDEGTQRMIIGIAGFAAAAGPVLSVVGRLVQFAGSAVSAFGAASAKMAALSATFTASKAAAGAAAGGLAGVAAGAKGVAASMGLATKAAGLLKLTVAGLAIAAVARVVGALSDAKTHSENLAAATDGLTGAFGAMAEGAATAADGVAGSLGTMQASAEDCMQSQMQLADSLSTLWGDTGANAALAQSYAATIEQLAGKTNLTAAEQAQLQSAVDGFNGVCGTSISVIDPLNGKLSEQVDAINAVKDAYVEQAKVQAAQQTLVEVQKQQIQNDIALKQAQDELAASAEGLYVEFGGIEVASDEAGRKHKELEQKVSDLTAQQESCGEAVAMATGILEQNAAAATSSKEAVAGWASASEGFQAACEAAGVSTEALGTALSQVGVSTSQLSTLSDEKLAQLAGSYDGTLTSIVSTLQGFGIEVGAAGAQAGQAWYDGLSSTAQQSVSAAMEVTGMTADQFAAAAQQAGVSGEEATVEFANGIAANAQQAANAAGAMKTGCVTAFDPLTGELTQISASAVGGATAAAYANAPGFSQAMAAASNGGAVMWNTLTGKLQATTAAEMGAATAAVNAGGFEAASAAGAQAAATSGAWNANLSGMNPATQGIASATVSGLVSTLDAAKAGAGGSGSGASSAYANGVGSSYRLASSNAATMAGTVRTWASLANQAYSWGAHTSSNFAAGVASGYGAAVAAAQRIANAVAAVLKHSVPKEGPLRAGGKGEAVWGEHAVENFAGGMSSAAWMAEDAARGVASATAAPLSAGSAPRAAAPSAAHANADSRALLEEVRALRDAQDRLLYIMEALFDGGFVVRRRGSDGARVTAYAR